MLPLSRLRVFVLCILLLTLLLPQPFTLQAAAPDVPVGVSFAWSATWGDAPQPGFAQATGIEVGPDGNVYVSDAVRNDIQVFTQSGELVRRYGGAGSNPGQFREPVDVTARGGKVYVADRSNARVQVLGQDGSLLLQIDGREPIEGGTNVRFPVKIGADATGRVFLFNHHDSELYRYSASGAFERRYDETCIVGIFQSMAVLSSGVAFCPSINGGVWRLPLDGAGTVIGDNTQSNSLGSIVHLATAPDDSVWGCRGNANSLSAPVTSALIHLSPDGALLGQFEAATDIVDIAASSERVFALRANRRVRMYDWAGQVLGEWGADAFAGSNTYERPDRLAAAPDGSFYVLERERKRVRHVGADGQVLAVLSPTPGAGNLSAPVDMAVDGLGRLYVLDLEYFPRILRFTGDHFDTVLETIFSYPYIVEPNSINVTGDTIVLMGNQPEGAGILRLDLRGNRIGQARVQGITSNFLDAALGAGNRLFALSYNPVVRAVDFFGTEFASWGTTGTSLSPGVFVHPTDITADLRGRTFVADTETPPLVTPPVHSNRVQVFDETGAFLTQFGGYGSEPGQFVNPQGITALSDGRIVVADTGNNRLQVFTPAGDLPALQPLAKPQTYGGAGPLRPAWWQDLGPRGLGSITHILIPPQPSPARPVAGLYSSGGLALSADGVHWTRQPSDRLMTGPLLYAGSHTLLAAGSWTDAAYRSEDLGRTWIRLGDLPPSGPRFLAPSPNYDQDHTLFLAAYRGGVWRSSDAGVTWELRSGQAQRFYDLVTLPGPGGWRVLLAIAGDKSPGILRSTDDGATWQVVDKSVPAKLYVSPTFTQDHTVFATDISLTGVRRSTDGGLTWTVVGAETGDRWYELSFSPAFATDKTVMLWLGTGGKSFISKDGGNTWMQFTPADAPRPRWMAFAPTYAADGAIWRQRSDAPMGIEVTRDAGVSWQPLTSAPGMLVHSVAGSASSSSQPLWAALPYGLASFDDTDAANPVYQYQHGWGGRVDVALSPSFHQDGTAIGEGVLTRDGGATWQDLPIASEVRSAIGAVSASHVVAFSPNYAQDGIVLVLFDEQPNSLGSDVRRSSDRGATWQNATVPAAGVRSIAFEPGFAPDRRVYAGGEGGVAISTDGGATWTNAGLPLSLLKVTGLAARLEAGAPVVYAATSSEGLWRSTDRGQTWAKFNEGLGDGYLCALDGNDALLATVTCAGQLYLRSGDAWQRVGAAVQGSINDLMVQGTGGAGRITVATSLGAFRISLPPAEPRRLWLPVANR